VAVAQCALVRRRERGSEISAKGPRAYPPSLGSLSFARGLPSVCPLPQQAIAFPAVPRRVFVRVYVRVSCVVSCRVCGVRSLTIAPKKAKL
jgi:hypothetical protein